ncbi:hypothetical protein SAMN06297468_2267 [Altererythrobacter xiamenensis]|uniref:Uncharacterized protein n=1 Tax=Altererythrobacter xiamenensis TaxID=1316679 RepID=A0A1Y6FFB7_9SPHN|nr:hypothetical protein [Altererythrobacter xiamenensis]SMQ73648.1 hypothetical protein SAMN06297468_2267 [Altererythrobacter xiamenensis]
MRRWGAISGAVAALLLNACTGEPHDAVLPEPQQTNIMGSFQADGMKRVARFDATVLVLSRKSYTGIFGDEMAEYSPFDLAVAWGEGALADVYGALSISQSNRFFYWKASNEAWQDPRVRRFGRNAGNWHIVPETDAVMDDFFEVMEGDVVQMEGFLVDIQGPRNFVWKTSRKRSDSGPGACEIFLVTKVSVVES